MDHFIDERINELIKKVSTKTAGGPRFSTRVVQVAGGEQRNENWSQSHGKWEFGEKVLSAAEADALQTFFWKVRGKLVSFRFKDWTDYRVKPGQGYARMTSEGLKLVKRYAPGIERIVNLPVAGYVVRVGADVRPASVNPETGVLSVGGGDATEDNVTWVGEYDVRVRFDVDELPLSLENIDLNTDEKHIILTAVPLVELT